MFKCEGVGCNRSFNSKIGRSLHHNKCKFYKKPIIDTSDYTFICECNKKFKTKSQLKGHQATCKKHLDIVEQYKRMITFELLNELYVKQKNSALQISKQLNYPYIGAGQIIQILKNFGFNTRTIKEATNTKKCRKLYEKTCINKYNDTNALGKNSPIYKKRNKTVFKKYGVSNVFQVKEVQDRIKNTLIERYGVDHPIKIPYRKFNNGRKSKIHIKVEELLNELSIKYISEDNRNLFENDGYSPRPDITIDELKIVIEINGDYWHANPDRYKPNDIIYKWGGPVLVKDIWNDDFNRKKQIESFGYIVIILWESFINKKLTNNKLWKILKLNQLKN